MAEPPPLIEWGIAARPRPGESRSGDAHLVRPVPGGVLVAAIDGLGHGEDAAAAAAAAVAALERHAGKALDALLMRCHEGLRGTRGAAMSLAFLSAEEGTMAWLGVGNVEAVLLRADAFAAPAREGLPLRGGVVGYQLPPLHVAVLPLGCGDTLVLATDGIRSSFADALSAGDHPQRMAERVLEKHGKGTDDALVLVVRYLRGAP